MKKKLLFALGAFLSLNAAASANTNALFIDYVPDAPNVADLAVAGDENVLSISQSFSLGADPLIDGPNVLKLTIDGDRNGGFEGALFSPLHFDGAPRPGAIAQAGTNNMLEFAVLGSNNLFAFAQTGNNNAAFGIVTGSGNQAAVQQIGNNNAAGFSQTGNGNIVNISQTSW